MNTSHCRRTGCRGSSASAINARIPPSPWLSARMTYARYFSEITPKSDQTMEPREDAEHVDRADRHAVLADEAFAHGVERARADVAIDDAERRQAEDGQVTAGRLADWRVGLLGQMDPPCERELAWVRVAPNVGHRARR